MFALAVSQEAWLGGMGPHTSCEVGVSPIHGDRPNSCLQIEYNRVVFVLMTLKGDPEWRYRVDELLPQARDPRPWGSCC